MEENPMKRMKQLGSLLVFVLVIALMNTGCNSSQAENKNDGTAKADSTSEQKSEKGEDENQDGIADTESIELLVELPTGNHWTRTVKIFNDEMYISIGSTCNACEEKHPWRASVVKCNLDGTDCEVFASGLRNAVDLTYYKDKIWITDNGRDLLKDPDLPPDET